MSATRWIIIALIFSAIFAYRVQVQGGLHPDNYLPSVELAEYSAFLGPFRQNISTLIHQLLPGNQAVLLEGMLIGVSGKLPYNFKTALSNTSTIHMVVVSGQNLSLLAGFVMGFVGLVGRRKLTLITIAIVIGYCFLTGLQIPILRAAIMAILGLLAQLFGRDRDGFWILVLAAGVMLLYQPDWLFSISFQLSFLATIGVIVVAKPLVQAMNFIPEIIRQDLAVSLAAQLMTWPIIAANFHQASVLGVLINTLLLWTVSFIMISGFVAVLVASFWFGLGQILALIPLALLTYFVYIVNFFNSISWTSIQISDYPMIIWFGYYIFILALVWGITQYHRQPH